MKSKQITAIINRAATLENAKRWDNTQDKLVLCSDILTGADIRAGLTTDEGEKNCIRLENKLARIMKATQ